MKKILIDTAHPGQIHQFRHLAQKLREAGHPVLLVSKSKDISKSLLDHYNLDHVMLGKPGKGILRKAMRLPGVYVRYLFVLYRFKPDIIISRFSLQSAHLAWLFRIPHIAYTDTEHVTRLDKYTVPFVKTRITSHSYQRSLGRNHYRFNGNTELFYLHPNHYKPDPGIFSLLKIEPGAPYAIVRFVSWDAHHDVGKQGLSDGLKQRIVSLISSRMRLFISSEGPLPSTLEPYRFTLPPHRMHDALAMASLYVGEGATLASEAAILGTPTIYVNPLTCGYVEDEAKAGLIVSLRSAESLEKAIGDVLATPNIKEKAQQLKEQYLADKCDPTAFFYWLITNHPVSLQKLKENPGIASHFRS